MNTRPRKNQQNQATAPDSKGFTNTKSLKDSKHRGEKGWRFVTRQLARIFLFLLAALVLLFVVCLLVIRSSWAEKYLTTEIPALLNPLLAEQGLFLELDQLSGPLPNRLALSGLRLHDQNGLFLEIDEVETRLALSELLSGALTVDVFQVVAPTLHRLPDVLPSAQEEEETPTPVTGLALDLPIDIRLKNIAINGASLPWAVIGLDGVSPNNPLPANPLPDNPLPDDDNALAKSDNEPIEQAVQGGQDGQDELAEQQKNHGQAQAIQAAWKQTLATPLRLDLDASAELSKGLLNASLSLRARDNAHSPKGLYGENFDCTFALTPAHFALIEADHNSADISANLALTLGGTSYTLNLGTFVELTETTARLTDLTLEGLGLSLRSSAEILLATGQPTASLVFTGSHMDDLILLLSALSGEPAERLEALISPLELNLEVKHSLQSLAFNLHKFQLGGVHVNGQASLGNVFSLAHQSDMDRRLPTPELADNSQARDSQNSTNAKASDDSDNSREAEKVTPPSQDSKPQDSSNQHGAELAMPKGPLTIQTKLALEVAALKALSPDVEGSLRGTVDVQGSLADLQSNVILTSPNLTTTSGDLHDFNVNLTASLKEDKVGQKSLQGALKATATPNPLGPTNIRLDWDAFVPPTDDLGLFSAPVTASIQQLQIDIFGLDLEGAVSARLSPLFLNPSQSPTAQNASMTEDVSRTATADVKASQRNTPKIERDRTDTDKSTVSNDQAITKGSHNKSKTMEILWPDGLALKGDIQASVKDWNPLSLFAQTPLSGKNTVLKVGLDHKENGQEAKVSAMSDSFNAPAQGFTLTGLDLKASAFLPSQQGKLPSIALTLATGQGEAADIPWRAIAAKVADEGGNGTFSLAVTQDSQRIRHKKAVAAQQGKAKQKSSVAANESPQEIHGQTKNAPLTTGQGQQTKQAFAQGQTTKFSSKLNKEDLLVVQGQYHLQDMCIALEKLALKEPLSQTEVQLRETALISLGEGLLLEDFILDLSSGGSISADISQQDNDMQAKATISSLPLRFINDVAGTTLPPGHIDADVSLQTSQQAPKGTVDFQLHLDGVGKQGNQHLAGQTGQGSPTGQAGQAGQTALTNQADVHLQANIIQSGGRSFLTGGLDFSRLASLAGKELSGQTSRAGQAGNVGLQPASAAMPTLTSQSSNPLEAPLTFKIPLSVAGGMPLPDTKGPFQANLRWQGPLDGFWRLVPLPDTEFSALASIDLGLSGTLAAPKTGGTAYVAQGYVYDKGLGLLLSNMALEIHASQNDEYRLVFAAEDGDKGSLGLEGALQLHGIPSLNLRGQLKRLAPLHRDDVKITLTGLLGANGPLHAPKVSADILVERGEIELLAAMGNGSVRTLPITDPDATVQEAHGEGGELDVTVTIPKRFYIRGLGLDSEWQGKLNINGGFSEPQIIGSLRPVRGYFELISKPFAFTGGEIVFVGGSKINPGLDLELTYTTNELEAIIKAGGNLEKPELDLQSNPPLPKDEVLAHVLFGKKISELSRFEALQLANSMSELAGLSSGNLNPLTSMRKATGLDVLRFGSDDDSPDQRQDSGMTGASNLGDPKSNGESATESAPTLEAGKYITDSIYIGVEQGMTQESTGVRVEIELFPNTTLQGKSTANSSSAGIGWKMDY